MPKKKKPAPKSAARRPVKPAPKAKALAKSAVKKPAPVTSAAPVVPSVTAFREAILRHLKSTFARDPITASRNDWWSATCMAARDLMLERYIATQSVHSSKNVRRVYYFSLEYLMGRVLSNNLVNLGLREVAAAALGADPQALRVQDRSALFSGHVQPCTGVVHSSCSRGYALNVFIRGGLHPRHDFTRVGVLQFRGQVDGGVRPFAVNQLTCRWQFDALRWGGGHDFSSAE